MVKLKKCSFSKQFFYFHSVLVSSDSVRYTQKTYTHFYSHSLFRHRVLVFCYPEIVNPNALKIG